MVFHCNTYRKPYPENVRVHQSLYASQVLTPGGFALRTYLPRHDGFVYVGEYCDGSTVDELAENLFALKNRAGKPLELVLAEPRDDFERERYPTVPVEGMQKILYVGDPSTCINFAQPAVWGTWHAATRHKEEMPCMTVDEQAAFLALLLPRATIRQR